MNNLNLLNILLMGPPQGSSQSQIPNLLTGVLIVIVFYFFMIRPQMKKTKEQKAFRESLKKGDKVITIGGLHGKIVDIDDEKSTITLEVDNNVKLKFEKSAISLENTQSTEVKK